MGQKTFCSLFHSDTLTLPQTRTTHSTPPYFDLTAENETHTQHSLSTDLNTKPSVLHTPPLPPSAQHPPLPPRKRKLSPLILPPSSTPSKTKLDDKQKAQTASLLFTVMILIAHRTIIDFNATHTDVHRLKEYLTHYRTELAQTILDGQVIDKHFLKSLIQNHLFLKF